MYLGIDYGKKRIGLAFSEGDIAHGIGFIENTPNRIEQIRQIANKMQITKAVIGIPNSPLDSEIKSFAVSLAQTFKWEIAYEDEYDTTNKAIQAMIKSGVKKIKRRENDSTAAAAILQSYLDSIE